MVRTAVDAVEMCPVHVQQLLEPSVYQIESFESCTSTRHDRLVRNDDGEIARVVETPHGLGRALQQLELFWAF
jgi:hypothetical protein